MLGSCGAVVGLLLVCWLLFGFYFVRLVGHCCKVGWLVGWLSWLGFLSG